MSLTRKGGLQLQLLHVISPSAAAFKPPTASQLLSPPLRNCYRHRFAIAIGTASQLLSAALANHSDARPCRLGCPNLHRLFSMECCTPTVSQTMCTHLQVRGLGLRFALFYGLQSAFDCIFTLTSQHPTTLSLSSTPILSSAASSPATS